MRLFELVLLFANMFSVFLPFFKRSSRIWLGTAAVNLFILLLLGLFEGFRYQMAFSYSFSILFIGYALWNIFRGSTRIRTLKPVKMIAAGLTLVLLSASVLLSTALPVFSLPQPTGSDSIGVQYFDLVDENRADPFLDESAGRRRLMVKVYYPAVDDGAKPFGSYFGGSSSLVRAFTSFYNLPAFTFDHLTLVTAHQKEGLPLSKSYRSYPVVLFSHGAGTSMEVHVAQCEDLASHGYIVVAVDHTYVSAATAFPDHIISHHDATTDFNAADPAEIITKIMANDVSFIIDTLNEINNGEISSIFQDRLDLDSIGVIGHSVGGATAYRLAINEPRVKAAVNLDGVVYDAPEAGANLTAPFLMIASDGDHVRSIQDRQPLLKSLEELPAEDREMITSMYGSEAAYQEAASEAQYNLLALADLLQSTGNLYTIEGSDHMKFTDIGLFLGLPQLREMLKIRGKTDPARTLQIANALTVAFFDTHLKGKRATSFDILLQTFPELRQVTLAQQNESE